MARWMAKRVNISTARKELPTLFNRVTSRDGEKVVIGRRDGGPEAVLVSRGYIERLEIASPKAPPGKPWSLFGSGTIVGGGTVEDVLAEVRAEDNRQTEKRLAEFTAPLPPRKARRR